MRKKNRGLLLLLLPVLLIGCDLFDEEPVGAIVPPLPDIDDSSPATNLVFISDDWLRATQATGLAVKPAIPKEEIGDPITVANPGGEGAVVVDGEINFSTTEDSSSELTLSFQDWQNTLFMTNSTELSLQIDSVVTSEVNITMVARGTITVSGTDTDGDYQLDLTTRATLDSSGAYTSMTMTGVLTVDSQEFVYNQFEVSETLLVLLN